MKWLAWLKETVYAIGVLAVALAGLASFLAWMVGPFFLRGEG